MFEFWITLRGTHKYAIRDRRLWVNNSPSVTSIISRIGRFKKEELEYILMCVLDTYCDITNIEIVKVEEKS